MQFEDKEISKHYLDLNFIGASTSDEMCNLYFMYYSKVDDGGFEACADIEDKDIPHNLPFDSDKLLPGDSNKNLFLFNAIF